MTFADAILKLRSERRMSQTQLAKELGVSYTSVNRWENGRSLPTKMIDFPPNWNQFYPEWKSGTITAVAAMRQLGLKNWVSAIPP